MKELRPSLMLFILFTLLCGGIYPAVVTGVAQAVFPKQANGSFITDRSNRVLGSSLIGQPFSGNRYFWPRPSSATDFSYNPMGSGGANSGPTNPDYLKAVADKVKALHDGGIGGSVPAGLAQGSGSGLDPDISPEAAQVQVARVATARSLSADQVRQLVLAHTKPRQLGFLGEPRVNVLELNLALDQKK